jgi:hypothetical protein
MQKWEHKVLVRGLNPKTNKYVWSDNTDDVRGAQDRLNELGWEGFELVAVVPISNWTGSDWSGRTTDLQYFLKRPHP